MSRIRRSCHKNTMRLMQYPYEAPVKPKKDGAFLEWFFTWLTIFVCTFLIGYMWLISG